MRGTITGKDVLRHAVTIVRHWGLACYLRCLGALASRRASTFLGVLSADCGLLRSISAPDAAPSWGEPAAARPIRKDGLPGQGRR